jgi:YVTN family beta-propeller protein
VERHHPTTLEGSPMSKPGTGRTASQTRLSLARASAACLTMMLVWSAFGATGRSQALPGRYVFAAGEAGSREGSTVVVFDLDTNQYVTTLPTGLAGRLSGLAVSPTGNRLYVSSDVRHRVHVVDTATATVAGSAAAASPAHLVLASATNRLYVASGMRVLVLDAATLAAIQSMPLPTPAAHLALSADGARFYVADGSNTLPLSLVRRLDPLTGQVLATSALQNSAAPFRIAVAPDGGRVYVTDVSGGRVHVLDGTTLGLVRTIAIAGYPTALAVSPSGDRVFVADDLNRSRLHVIDTSAGTVSSTLDLGSGFAVAGRSLAMLVSPDGQRLVRADEYRSEITVYTLATGAAAASGQWIAGQPSLIAASAALASSATAAKPVGCRAPYCLDECVDALTCGTPNYCDQYYFCGAFMTACGYSARLNRRTCRFDLFGRCPGCGI